MRSARPGGPWSVLMEMLNVKLRFLHIGYRFPYHRSAGTLDWYVWSYHPVLQSNFSPPLLFSPGRCYLARCGMRWPQQTISPILFARILPATRTSRQSFHSPNYSNGFACFPHVRPLRVARRHFSACSCFGAVVLAILQLFILQQLSGNGNEVNEPTFMLKLELKDTRIYVHMLVT